MQPDRWLSRQTAACAGACFAHQPMCRLCATAAVVSACLQHRHGNQNGRADRQAVLRQEGRGRSSAARLSPRRVVQQLDIDAAGGQVHVAHHAAAHKAVAHRQHVGVLGLVHHPDAVELDVEVLVHRVKGAADGQVVLQLHSDLQAGKAARAGSESRQREQAARAGQGRGRRGRGRRGRRGWVAGWVGGWVGGAGMPASAMRQGLQNGNGLHSRRGGQWGCGQDSWGAVELPAGSTGGRAGGGGRSPNTAHNTPPGRKPNAAATVARSTHSTTQPPSQPQCSLAPPCPLAS